METCGQWFSGAMVERIKARVAQDPAISRRALSREVCEWLDWRSPNGRLKEMSCRKALGKLERRGIIELPKRAEEYAFARRRLREPRELPEGAHVRGSMGELGRVELVLVPSGRSKLSAVWNGLMDRYHPLGSGPLCGAQLRYLVRSERYGWLGGVSFSGATWRLKARDKWIGWSEAARREHLPEVVCNSRFLIVPTVEVANLASRVLGLSVRRLRGDWEARYGYAPVLVESFVDGSQFRGTSYQATNWKYVGQTAARPTPHPNGKVSEGRKDVYLHSLCRDWRERLCSVAQRRLGLARGPVAAADWVEEEFGRVALHDERLRQRLYTMARDFWAKPGELIPHACRGSEAKTKGAYRFVQNRQVDMETVLRSHVEATVDRLREHAVVLAVQDTTSLNYTTHAAEEGLGPIGSSEDGAVGLLLHDTVAFTVAGTPLGLLDAQCWARDPETPGKRHQRKQLPIGQKESMKWLRSYQRVTEVQQLCPATTLVSVADREADVYELFAEAHNNPQGPKLLVRAEKSRNREVAVKTAAGSRITKLWDAMEHQGVAGYQEVVIPSRTGRPPRTAKLAVRFAKVMLQPPHGKPLPTLEVWAVFAREVNRPATVKEPLEWMLVTTVATLDFTAACERLTWYARRWGIEVFHRTLKSGCRIEDRRLNTAERLEVCLAIDLVVAWRVYLLTKQGRETPDVPCSVFLSEEEWQVLCADHTGGPPPTTPPSLRDAIRMIASLGGFLGRKCDGEPGTTTIWRGVVSLADMVRGFRAALAFLAHARGSPWPRPRS